MKLETLDGLGDAEIRSIQERCAELLALRDRERKANALEQARATLAAVGLSIKDLAGKGRARPSKAPSYTGGRTYQHPADKTLVWTAKGQKPGWLRDLEKEGGKAVEIEAENGDTPARTPTDTAAAIARKTG